MQISMDKKKKGSAHFQTFQMAPFRFRLLTVHFAQNLIGISREKNGCAKLNKCSKEWSSSSGSRSKKRVRARRHEIKCWTRKITANNVIPKPATFEASRSPRRRWCRWWRWRRRTTSVRSDPRPSNFLWGPQSKVSDSWLCYCCCCFGAPFFGHPHFEERTDDGALPKPLYRCRRSDCYLIWGGSFCPKVIFTSTLFNKASG